jgi:polyphosphate kinase 2 (PPK2 family)
VPSAEELDHDYLWRAAKALPARGMIGIFNRSYYEEVLVVRVHPEFLAKQRLPASVMDEDIWQRRFQEINNFEKYLVRNGIVVLKFFPQRLQKGAKETVPRPDRRAGEELEILRGRLPGACLLGRLPKGP